MEVLNFLAEIFDSGVSYSAVGTARSALSTFLWVEGKPAGTHPLVCWFLRGVFAERPALPRYEVTWDVKSNQIKKDLFCSSNIYTKTCKY